MKATNIFKGLWNVLSTNPVAFITTGLTIGMTAWEIYNKSVQESIERATEAASSWKESNAVLSEQIAKYKELKSQLDSGTLTPAEEYETRKQILEIQTQITSQYGQQASGIDLVNGSLKTQLGLLQQISSENAQKMLNENRKEYKTAEKEMNRKRNYRVADITNAMSDIDSSGEPSAFAKELRDIINSYDEIRLMADDFGMYIQMDMLSKGTGSGSVADVFNQYTEAVENYNNAISSGNTDSINKARADFASLSSEMDTLLSKNGNSKYAALFDDVTEQLNTAGIKMFDFEEALNGKAGGSSQFNKISGDIRDTSERLKELKIDAVEAMTALVTEGSQTGENELWTLAEAWGLSAESSKEEMQAFVDILSRTGIVSGEAGNFAEDASKSFDSFSSTVQKSAADFETLKSIMAESVSGSGISAEHVSAFREMFGADADKALEKTAGGYHLNKTALAQLQAQMGEITKADYLTALSDQYTELQNIEGQIAAAEIFGQDTSGLEASRNGILENISSLQELQYQYETAASAYQQWQSAMSGGEEGDKYDSIYNNLGKAGELYDEGLTGTNKFREFTDLMSNKDLSTASNEEVVRAYEEALPNIQRFFTAGQEGAYNFLQEVESINSEWAHMNEDGSWDLNFGEGNDQAVADMLHIDVEAVQAILGKLNDYGFEIHLDEPAASLEALKTQAESANESIKSMGEDLLIDFGADSYESVDGQISLLREYIDEVQDSDLELDVKTDTLEDANSILEYFVARKQEIGENGEIDIAFDIDESELQSGYDTLSQLKSGLENLQGKTGIDKAVLEADINSCVAQIETMSPELKVALGIQNMSTDQIKAGLLNGSVEVPVSADTAQANSSIDGIKNNKIEDKNVTVTANTVQASFSLAIVRGYLSGITDKTVTVTVNRVSNSSWTGNGAAPNDSLQGPASIQGTAFIGGNWGNPTAGKKLVGELGREIIVNPHTGRWYTVGDNGAEFVEVPKNAIVFNHLQSDSLLKSGRVLGRGQALAGGTAYSSGSGRFNAGGSGSKSYSSFLNNIAYTSNTAAGAVSSAASSMSQAAEDLKDFVEIYLDRASDLTQRQIDAIDRAVGLSDKQNENAKAVSAIQSEITKNRQAYDRYMQQANSIGLSEAYASQIRDGSLNIESI